MESGEKWEKLVKSWNKWGKVRKSYKKLQKVEKSGQKCLGVAIFGKSGEKWGKVAKSWKSAKKCENVRKSGEKWQKWHPGSGTHTHTHKQSDCNNENAKKDVSGLLMLRDRSSNTEEGPREKCSAPLIFSLPPPPPD